LAKPEFKGSYVAIVTPFDESLEVDVEGIRTLVKMHVAAGTDGIIVLGSAGESWMLNDGEKDLLVTTTLDEANGRIPIVAGATRVATSDAVKAAKKLEDMGVDAIMVAAPPYVVPTQEGLYRHYESVCGAVGVSTVLYNVPYRSTVNVDSATVVRLFEEAGLAAYKEAGRNMVQVADVIEKTRGRLPLMVCDAPAYGLVMPSMALGGNGTANITGNVAPREMALLSRPWDSWAKVEEARTLYYRLLPLMKEMYSQTNPVAVKALMGMVGLPAGGLRLPLQPLRQDELKALQKRVEDARLLEGRIPKSRRESDRLAEFLALPAGRPSFKTSSKSP
jgi:4-hydroxy-tetrahydrodipicolinate synthase